MRRMRRRTVVFPQPLSPTSPRHSLADSKGHPVNRSNRGRHAAEDHLQQPPVIEKKFFYPMNF
jgi:hypothetical protein